MRRSRKTSPAEAFVVLVSMLPWWGALLLALVSYLGLHAYVTQPDVTPISPGQVADAMVPLVFKAIARVLQYVLPMLCVIAAIISGIKKLKSPSPVVSKSESVAQDKSSSGGSSAAPQCPVCSSTMVMRTATRGANAGKSFWGCSNYPGCKGTRPAT